MELAMKLTFIGAASTVTGSKHLLEVNNLKILIDCGLYQGIKNYRTRNWQALPFDVTKLDAVLLTHAHIDHSGYIPLLYKQGFRGPIFCSHETLKLCEVLMPDAGFLQEEDAKYANKKRFSKHSPAEPLYTLNDAKKSLSLFVPLDFQHNVEILPNITINLKPNGHILGSSSIELNAKSKTLVFSGDVGRQDDPIMYPPEPISPCDLLVVEATYGDRRHTATDTKQILADAINDTFKRGGIFLMPSFAVGRAQLILHLIAELKREQRIPNVPVYLNSPMAIKVTDLYEKAHKHHKLTKEQCQAIDDMTEFVKTQEESEMLNSRNLPCIIVSASGMASGGRVLHHLKSLLPDDKHTVAFLGFQAAGTRGEALINGAERIKIHGEYIDVKANVLNLDSLSAHGDYQDILNWLQQGEALPKQIYINHGEVSACDAMRCHIKEQLGIDAKVAEYLEQVAL